MGGKWVVDHLVESLSLPPVKRSREDCSSSSSPSFTSCGLVLVVCAVVSYETSTSLTLYIRPLSSVYKASCHPKRVGQGGIYFISLVVM